MVKKFIFLIIVFFGLLFAVVSYAADAAVTDNDPVSDKQTPTKSSTSGQALKGSDPAQGIIIGNPAKEEEMLLNPVKKKKRVKKQEEAK